MPTWTPWASRTWTWGTTSGLQGRCEPPRRASAAPGPDTDARLRGPDPARRPRCRGVRGQRDPPRRGRIDRLCDEFDQSISQAEFFDALFLGRFVDAKWIPSGGTPVGRPSTSWSWRSTDSRGCPLVRWGAAEPQAPGAPRASGAPSLRATTSRSGRCSGRSGGTPRRDCGPESGRSFAAHTLALLAGLGRSSRPPVAMPQGQDRAGAHDEPGAARMLGGERPGPPPSALLGARPWTAAARPRGRPPRASHRRGAPAQRQAAGSGTARRVIAQRAGLGAASELSQDPRGEGAILVLSRSRAPAIAGCRFSRVAPRWNAARLPKHQAYGSLRGLGVVQGSLARSRSSWRRASSSEGCGAPDGAREHRHRGQGLARRGYWSLTGMRELREPRLS